ncbi:hypothetical protein AB1K70_16645 [Bremerella sp. JC770]|uniref:hypothetical protein n=1 Tax=Bremerella sp. JC770 TaxID=3232137 RepID=UPI0034594F3C
MAADRRDLTVWASFVVAVTKWTLPSSVRESWMNSFQVAFAIDEVKNIVKQSSLCDEVDLKITSRMYSIQAIKAPT